MRAACCLLLATLGCSQGTKNDVTAPSCTLPDAGCAEGCRGVVVHWIDTTKRCVVKDETLGCVVVKAEEAESRCLIETDTGKMMSVAGTAPPGRTLRACTSEELVAWNQSGKYCS